MRPAVRTRRQAYQRLTVAFNAVTDVLRLAERDVAHEVIPARAVGLIAYARSAVRGARNALNHSQNHNNTNAQ